MIRRQNNYELLNNMLQANNGSFYVNVHLAAINHGQILRFFPTRGW